MLPNYNNQTHKINLDKILSSCNEMLVNSETDNVNSASNQVSNPTQATKITITSDDVSAKIIEKTRGKTE